VFEVLERNGDPKISLVCPECGGKRLDRRISVFAARQGRTSPQVGDEGCPRCGTGPCQGSV